MSNKRAIHLATNQLTGGVWGEGGTGGGGRREGGGGGGLTWGQHMAGVRSKQRGITFGHDNGNYTTLWSLFCVFYYMESSNLGKFGLNTN